MSATSVRVISTLRGIEDLRSGWGDLQAAAGTALLDLDYIMAFIEAYGVKHIRVVALEMGGQLKAVAPLRIERRRGLSWLEFFDQPVQEVHAGFLHDGPEAALGLCRGIMALGLPLRLVRLPVRSPVSEAFRRLAEERICISRVSSGIPTAEFLFPAGGPDKALGGDNLRKLRHRWRKAEAQGPVQATFHMPGPDEAGELIERFIRVESSGWKGRGGTGLAFDRTMGGFFTCVALKAAERGQLLVAFLTIDGKPAAARLATEAYGALWDHKIGYDESFAAMAPGVLLTWETLRWSYARGNIRHVFLGNHEEWQDRWKPEIVQTCTIKAFPISVRGLLGLADETAAYVMRRLTSSAAKS